MRRSHLSVPVAACLILLVLATHATALVTTREIQVSPPGGSLPGGSVVNVSAELEIIPAGATTFAGTHTLSLTTDLLGAVWQVVVYVDGIQAAVIPKSGNTVFVNGYLLSYPTTRDVSVKIVLDGSVPPMPESTEFAVFRFAELNSQGSVVSGSEYSVTRTIPGNVTRPSTLPPETRSPVATHEQKAALSCVPMFAALVIVLSWTRMRG